ncbi:MAG: hypothetical protein ACLU3D_08185 [Acutalibacteraceae bacterium]|nr:hypothetical protein [Clostridiales bacterium]
MITASEMHSMHRQYQRYEAGASKSTFAVLLRLADGFSVSLDVLSRRSDSPDMR